MSNKVAKEGNVFVCLACGKRSKDKYGDEAIDRGWDVSCMLNSAEFDESLLEFDEDGMVCSIRAEEADQEQESAEEE